MKAKSLILLLLAIVIITSAGSFMYYALYKVVHTERSEYSFTVQNHVGLVGDYDSIKFGGVTPEGFGKRQISFRNTYDFPVMISISIEGEKSEWITSEVNNFVLQPEEAREVALIVSVPKDAAIRANYTGKVTARYLRT